MTTEQIVWSIFFSPLAAFLLICFVLRPAGAHGLAGLATIVGVAGALGASVVTFLNVLAVPGHELPLADYPWLTIGDLRLHLGLAVDSLTSVMLLVVTSVSLLVQVYSLGYMAGDTGYSRYYAYMALFTTSMLGLVLADNLLQLYVFWELVGLCSYLLIGFWFHRPAAAAAAKKAFVVTRFGDLGFLLALLALASVAGTLTINELFTEHKVAALVGASFLGVTALTWVALGLFAGAAGKSAQFPLHVWLPDAMEGPTPVSALIHAATMVAAGVYLVGRMLPLFQHAPAAMAVVASTGAVTALMAATMGLVATDIKRVMAYSTVSQLGYMMLALGLGGYVAAFFHLMNHAFFKALLFLGAGSVSHTTGTFDMRYMGGLRRAMPVTFWTVLLASLSLAGIPPLSGFWSKDEILATALAASPGLFWLAMATVLLTAFYVFRMLLLTFTGEYRGGGAAEAAANGDAAQGADAHGHGGVRLHESPSVMALPLVMLAAPAVLSGLVNLPTIPALDDFLMSRTVRETLEAHHVAFNPLLAAFSTGMALLGIALAWLVYGVKALRADSLGSALGGLPYRMLYHKYGLDFLYEKVLVGSLLYTVVCGLFAALDRYVVDGLVNGAGQLTRGLGRGLRRVETGQVQAYGLAIFLGVVVITAVAIVRG
ncbi:MAG: NADH-quinone oxidoreductase subunit L [Chloroflexi bacterium]|nr:NADH-quinone oxidoreductase subunit L [Chloroflexota bacterium]